MNVRRKTTQTPVIVRRGHPRRHRTKMPSHPAIRIDRHPIGYQIIHIPTQPDNISLWSSSTASTLYMRPQDQTGQFFASLYKIQSLLKRPLKNITPSEFESIAQALAQITWVLHHYETELYDGVIPVESIQQAQTTIKSFYRKLMNFVRLLNRRLNKKAYLDEHRIFSKAFHLRKLLQEFYQKDVYVVSDFEYPLIALAIKGLIRNQITIEQNPKENSLNIRRPWIHEKTSHQLLSYLGQNEPSDDLQPQSIWIDKMITEFEDMHYDYADRTKIDAELGRILLTARLNHFYDHEPELYTTLRKLIDSLEDLDHKPHLIQKAIYYILRSLIYCKDVQDLKKYIHFFYDQRDTFENIRPTISAFSAQYYCYVHFDHYNFGTNSEIDIIQQFIVKPGIRVVKIGKRYPIDEGIQEVDVVIEITDPETQKTHFCLVEIKSSKLNFGDAQAGRYHSVAPEGSAIIFISPKFKKPEIGTPGEGQVLHISPRHVYLRGAGYLSQLLRQIEN